MTATEQYKILAFIFLFKACRKNSLRYSHETVSACLRNCGIRMPYNTFKKYWELCEKLGLITKIGKHQGIIGWDQCIDKLGLTFSNRRINKIIKSRNISTMTFTQITNWVEQSLFLMNFKAQQYKIDRKEDKFKIYKALANDKPLRQGDLRKIAGSARKEGLSLKQYALSMLAKHNNKIVTGSYHLSSLFGISQKKCNTLLNGMVKNNIITRTIIINRWFEGEVNASTFDLAKELSGNALIIPSAKCFFQVVGSEISLLPQSISKF